jgi:hypothetical protein
MCSVHAETWLRSANLMYYLLCHVLATGNGDENLLVGAICNLDSGRSTVLLPVNIWLLHTFSKPVVYFSLIAF